MLETLSMRTSESVAVSDTSLPALLKVAESLLSALGPAVLAALVWGAGAAGVVTPRSDFKPSRLLRMSIRITPCKLYRHPRNSLQSFSSLDYGIHLQVSGYRKCPI